MVALENLLILVLAMIMFFGIFISAPLCIYNVETPPNITSTTTHEKIKQYKNTTFGPFFLTGKSMEPALPSNAICYFEHADDYNVGDVVIFPAYEGSDLILVDHRIVSENETHYITKGDANAIADPPVPKDIVLFRLKYAPMIVVWIRQLSYDIHKNIGNDNGAM